MLDSEISSSLGSNLFRNERLHDRSQEGKFIPSPTGFFVQANSMLGHLILVYLVKYINHMPWAREHTPWLRGYLTAQGRSHGALSCLLLFCL